MRIRMPLPAACLVLIVALLVTGCQTLRPAQSLDERLLYAYATQTGVLRGVSAALDADALAPEEAERVIEHAQEARRHLDTARNALELGRAGLAEDHMALAVTLLLTAQRALDSGSSP